MGSGTMAQHFSKTVNTLAEARDAIKHAAELNFTPIEYGMEGVWHVGTGTYEGDSVFFYGDTRDSTEVRLGTKYATLTIRFAEDI